MGVFVAKCEVTIAYLASFSSGAELRSPLASAVAEYRMLVAFGAWMRVEHSRNWLEIMLCVERLCMSCSALGAVRVVLKCSGCFWSLLEPLGAWSLGDVGGAMTFGSLGAGVF